MKVSIENKLNKVMKKTWHGRLVADARRVMEMELVLEAKITESFVILSSSENSFFFTTSDSTMASMTTSADWRSSKFDVHLRRLKASLPRD